ncbi:MAG: lasso peptide biosynthesis B2 protein [Sphingomonadaceae bacterium]
MTDIRAGNVASVRQIWRDKWLFLFAFFYLWVARIRLSTYGFGDPRANTAGNRQDVRTPADLGRRVAWAVDRAARLVPGDTCLVRAIAGQRVLALKGFRSDIFIGVRKNAHSPLEAHAWLACGDYVILGLRKGDEMAYARLIAPDD